MGQKSLYARVDICQGMPNEIFNSFIPILARLFSCDQRPSYSALLDTLSLLATQSKPVPKEETLQRQKPYNCFLSTKRIHEKRLPDQKLFKYRHEHPQRDSICRLLRVRWNRRCAEEFPVPSLSPSGRRLPRMSTTRTVFTDLDRLISWRVLSQILLKWFTFYQHLKVPWQHWCGNRTKLNITRRTHLCVWCLLLRQCLENGSRLRVENGWRY